MLLIAFDPNVQSPCRKLCTLLTPSPLNEGQYSSCGNYSSFYNACSASELMNAKMMKKVIIISELRAWNMHFFSEACTFFPHKIYGKGGKQKKVWREHTAELTQQIWVWIVPNWMFDHLRFGGITRRNRITVLMCCATEACGGLELDMISWTCLFSSQVAKDCQSVRQWQ